MCGGGQETGYEKEKNIKKGDQANTQKVQTSVPPPSTGKRSIDKFGELGGRWICTK